MIHVRQLTKSYTDLRRGQIVALAGISFDVWPGQIYGLLGPNGAGKTTALRILSTVLSPSAGHVTVGGFDVRAEPSMVRRRINVECSTTARINRSSIIRVRSKSPPRIVNCSVPLPASTSACTESASGLSAGAG